jgi:hypothetical protein
MAQSAEGLQALFSHESGDSNATDDDGGSGGYPSQGDVDMHKKMTLRVLAMIRVTTLAV